MTAIRHLTNAPITEGLIEIRYSRPSRSNDSGPFLKLAEALKDDYPDHKPLRQFRFEFSEGPPERKKQENTFAGCRLGTSDGLQIVQASFDRIVFSRLKPYQSWEQLKQEARKVWSAYEAIVQPETIIRVATRFINSIAIPPLTELSEYLCSPPIVPANIPQNISSFFTRLVIPDSNGGWTAIVTQSIDPAASPNVVHVLIDVDVYAERSFESSDDAWRTLEGLREVKNLIFFESITDKALEPYI